LSAKLSDKKFNTGDIITAEVTGYTHEGAGVARLYGRVIFIAGALRGELVRAEIMSERRGILYARLLVVLPQAEPTGQPRRAEPLCPVYNGCGGCQLQHMSYAEELLFKQEQVRAALQRIAGLADLSGSVLRPIIAAVAPAGEERLYHYRNKGIFHVSRTAGGYSLGFWAEDSHRPAGAACHLLFPEAVNALLDRLQQGDLPDSASDVLVRYSFAQRKLMLFLRLPASVSAAQLAACRSFLERLCAEFTDLLVYGVQINEAWQVWSAEKYLTDALGDVEYQIAPESFFQVNNAQTLRLLAVLRSALAEDTKVLLDAYCGIGTLGIYLAKHLPDLRRLLGIELNAGAVANARQNARLNGLTTTEFWQGRAEQEFGRLLKQNCRIDAVIVDPPRKGCHKQLLEGLLHLQPAQLLYVSCNPATLARDLQLLCADKYMLQLVQPIDMFPRTHHVETVAVLSRVK